MQLRWHSAQYFELLVVGLITRVPPIHFLFLVEIAPFLLGVQKQNVGLACCVGSTVNLWISNQTICTYFDKGLVGNRILFLKNDIIQEYTLNGFSRCNE